MKAYQKKYIFTPFKITNENFFLSTRIPSLEDSLQFSCSHFKGYTTTELDCMHGKCSFLRASVASTTATKWRKKCFVKNENENVHAELSRSLVASLRESFFRLCSTFIFRSAKSLRKFSSLSSFIIIIEVGTAIK